MLGKEIKILKVREAQQKEYILIQTAALTGSNYRVGYSNLRYVYHYIDMSLLVPLLMYFVLLNLVYRTPLGVF